MDFVRILVSDWNSNDRVVTVKRDEAITILNDITKLASVRMNLLYDAALANGSINMDPTASAMNEAEIFLSWPGIGVGFVKNEDWDKEFAEDLYYLAHGEYNND